MPPDPDPPRPAVERIAACEPPGAGGAPSGEGGHGCQIVLIRVLAVSLSIAGVLLALALCLAGHWWLGARTLAGDVTLLLILGLGLIAIELR
jgi:hypothetical protein